MVVFSVLYVFLMMLRPRRATRTFTHYPDTPLFPSPGCLSCKGRRRCRQSPGGCGRRPGSRWWRSCPCLQGGSGVRYGSLQGERVQLVAHPALHCPLDDLVLLAPRLALEGGGGDVCVIVIAVAGPNLDPYGPLEHSPLTEARTHHEA